MSYNNSPDYQDDHEECWNGDPSPQQNIVYSMQMDRFEVFKAQDQENGYFDCVLEIDGKEIYVHKYFLVTASETFKAMFSDRWNNKSKDEAIKIENPDYSFENFYELLCFIYSGTCNLTKENVFVITDMAEYYGIQFLKERCDKFLQNINIILENIEEMVEFSAKYSLSTFSRVLKRFVGDNFNEIISSEHFVNCCKTFIEFLLVSINCKNEAFFEACYKWAEFQVRKLEFAVGDLNTEEWIKTELKDFSSYFDSSRLSFKFVKESILNKQSLFSTPELYRILVHCQKNNGEHDECFKILYELAKTEVAEKLQPLTEENINVAIKEELTAVIPDIKFHPMSVKFLMEFVVENEFEFSFVDLYYAVAYSRSAEIPEEAFKAVYRLAEKKVLMKQKLLNDENFNLSDAIKKELAPVISRVKFREMEVKFLRDFVVSNGILSEEEFYRLLEVSIYIYQENKIIHGIFTDVFGIKKVFSKNGNVNPPQSWNKLSCSDKKFEIPSASSTVMKTEDVQWYLCLNTDGILMVKHHTLVESSDYLIDEMKTKYTKNFVFKLESRVYISASFNNV